MTAIKWMEKQVSLNINIKLELKAEVKRKNRLNSPRVVARACDAIK